MSSTKGSTRIHNYCFNDHKSAIRTFDWSGKVHFFSVFRLPNGLRNFLKDSREHPIILSTASMSEDNHNNDVATDTSSRMVESRTCRLGHRHFKVHRLRQSSGRPQWGEIFSEGAYLHYCHFIYKSLTLWELKKYGVKCRTYGNTGCGVFKGGIQN